MRREEGRKEGGVKGGGRKEEGGGRRERERERGAFLPPLSLFSLLSLSK